MSVEIHEISTLLIANVNRLALANEQFYPMNLYCSPLSMQGLSIPNIVNFGVCKPLASVFGDCSDNSMDSGKADWPSKGRHELGIRSR